MRSAKDLRAAIESVLAQRGFDPGSAELLIVDNSVDGAAAWIGHEFADAPLPLRYVHEPRPGPSHARNRAVAEAKGNILVFLDDDQTAEPGWLAHLLSAVEGRGVDAAFGAVVPQIGGDAPQPALAEHIYSRRIDARAGATISHRFAALGTGNSAFRMTCFNAPEPFSLELATSGGEDVVFLRDLVRRGGKLIWAPDARVNEHIDPARLTMEALRLRRLRQGQIRALMCARGNDANAIALGFWMSAGLMQAAAHGALLVLASSLGRKEAAERARIRMAGGLGKLFWWQASPISYGPPAPAPQDPAAAR